MKVTAFEKNVLKMFTKEQKLIDIVGWMPNK